MLFTVKMETRDWCAMATSQEMPSALGNHRKLREGEGTGEDAHQSLQTEPILLASELQASGFRAVKKLIYSV